MERLNTLVIGSGITDERRELVKKSLSFFIQELCGGEDTLGNKFAEALVFEDIVARPQSVQIREAVGKYGYVLVLGSKAMRAFERSYTNGDLEVCHTMDASEWSGQGRDMIIKQLKGFVSSWVQMTVEGRTAAVAETDEHEVEWILQNMDQFKRHIQLMIQNGRPHSACFQSEGEQTHCILKDATKRLKTPITEVVPVVVESSCVREEFQKILETNGYPKVFFMDIDEFMAHITLMCLQMGGKPALIKVEPNNA